MNQSLAIAAVIILMVVAANIPFVTERILGVFPFRARDEHQQGKPIWVRLLEVLFFYALTIGLGFLFEGQIGNRFSQGWEFYAITLSVFLTCAYPGFVWRYLRRRRGQGMGRHASPSQGESYKQPATGR